MQSIQRFEPSQNFTAVSHAVAYGQVDRLRELLEAGAKLNECDGWSSETAFTDGLDCIDSEGRIDDDPNLDACLQAVRLGCLCGAELHYSSSVEPEPYLWYCGPGFVTAVFAADAVVLALLLMQRGDPNWSNKREFPWPHASSFISSLMSESILQYEEIVFGINEPPPEPDWRVHYEAAHDSSLKWIDYLDQVAVKHGLRRPDNLYLLHAFGAREREEFKVLLMADPSWQPSPPEEAMGQAMAWCRQRGDADGLARLEKVVALCKVDLPMPKRMLPQRSAKPGPNAMLTGDEIMSRPGWSRPLIHRLLKMHDRITHYTATGTLVKSYRTRRVERVESQKEFKAAVARRRNPAKMAQNPQGRLVGAIGHLP